MPRSRRSVAVVSGSRAEYGILLSVMRAIQEHPRLRHLPVCAGMHLSKKFGETAQVYKRDGFKIAGFAPMTPSSDSSQAMATSVGHGVIEFARVYRQIKPDVVLVLGDRTEALAAAIAAAYMNIYLAHIHGGDSARAGLDESARHAISKFAHIHFPATRLSAERVRKLGEEPWRIFQVGSPAADHIVGTPILSRQELSEKLKVEIPKKYALLVYHPLSTAPEASRRDFGEVLAALKQRPMPVIAICPNSDAGHSAIFEELARARRQVNLNLFVSLPREQYLSLLKHSAYLIGNSSSGIIDAPFFKKPVISIGARQEGRERATNVLDAVPSRTSIVRNIDKAVSARFNAFLRRTCRSPYGRGRTGERIADILAKLRLEPFWLQKKISY